MGHRAIKRPRQYRPPVLQNRRPNRRLTTSHTSSIPASPACLGSCPFTFYTTLEAAFKLPPLRGQLTCVRSARSLGRPQVMTTREQLSTLALCIRHSSCPCLCSSKTSGRGNYRPDMRAFCDRHLVGTFPFNRTSLFVQQVAFCTVIRLPVRVHLARASSIQCGPNTLSSTSNSTIYGSPSIANFGQQSPHKNSVVAQFSLSPYSRTNLSVATPVGATCWKE